MKFCTLTMHSESGDDYGPFIFKEKPSEAKIKKWLKEQFPDEADVKEIQRIYKEVGPGDYGTFLYLKWDETEVLEL